MLKGLPAELLDRPAEDERFLSPTVSAGGCQEEKRDPLHLVRKHR
jgi:hypothetical protein